jgi:hypothetical protein
LRRPRVERAAFRGVAAAVLWLALALAPPVRAHTSTPEHAAAEIATGPLAAELGVTSAQPHPGLPRLLHIEVDARWGAAPAERRLRAAAEWRALWRESTPGGLIAVTDASGASLVGFDAQGRPNLTAPTRTLDARPRDRGTLAP